MAFPAPNPKLPRPRGWAVLSSLHNTAILTTWPFSPLTHLAAAPGSLSPFPAPRLLAWFGSASPVHSERLQMPLPLSVFFLVSIINLHFSPFGVVLSPFILVSSFSWFDNSHSLASASKLNHLTSSSLSSCFPKRLVRKPLIA